jgi:DNA-binding transcriptional ArsR family regulator
MNGSIACIGSGMTAAHDKHPLARTRLTMRSGASPSEIGRPWACRRTAFTFHFDRLRHASLIAVRREGRSMIYSARFDTMHALVNYLTMRSLRDTAQRKRCRGRCSPSLPISGP